MKTHQHLNVPVVRSRFPFAPSRRRCRATDVHCGQGVGNQESHSKQNNTVYPYKMFVDDTLICNTRTPVVDAAERATIDDRGGVLDADPVVVVVILDVDHP